MAFKETQTQDFYGVLIWLIWVPAAGYDIADDKRRWEYEERCCFLISGPEAKHHQDETGRADDPPPHSDLLFSHFIPSRLPQDSNLTTDGQIDTDKNSINAKAPGGKRKAGKPKSGWWMV